MDSHVDSPQRTQGSSRVPRPVISLTRGYDSQGTLPQVSHQKSENLATPRPGYTTRSRKGGKYRKSRRRKPKSWF